MKRTMDDTQHNQKKTSSQAEQAELRPGFWDRIRHKMEAVGTNVDQINMFGRMKDVYKIFETVADYALIFAGASLGFRYTQNEKPKSLHEELRRPNVDAAIKIGVAADVVNTAYQLGLSRYSYWLEKREMQRTYGGLVKDELGLSRPANFQDMKRSQNPIIRDTAKYYSKKNLWRTLPDFAGLIRVVPFLLGAVSTKARESNWLQALKLVPGIKLGLGMKTAFFGWYFTSRQTGTNYAMRHIWDKTEGLAPKMRSYNHGALPGELVTSEELTKLYDEYCKDYSKREFTINDPLTGRIFDHIARHLNYHYMRDLYMEKKTEFFEAGVNQEVGLARKHDLEGTNMTHAKLVELVGTDGIDVDDALLTAIRLEVISRNGVEAYREVNQRLKAIRRPAVTLLQGEYEEALVQYFEALNHEAHQSIGEAWPPYYVDKRISGKILDSYLDENPNVTRKASEPLRQRIEQSFRKYSTTQRHLINQDALEFELEHDARASQGLEDIRREAVPFAPQRGQGNSPPSSSAAHQNVRGQSPDGEDIRDAASTTQSETFAPKASRENYEHIKPRSLTDFALSNEQVPEGVNVH